MDCSEGGSVSRPLSSCPGPFWLWDGASGQTGPVGCSEGRRQHQRECLLARGAALMVQQAQDDRQVVSGMFRTWGVLPWGWPR